jgi:hypothetical protein
LLVKYASDHPRNSATEGEQGGKRRRLQARRDSVDLLLLLLLEDGPRLEVPEKQIYRILLTTVLRGIGRTEHSTLNEPKNEIGGNARANQREKIQNLPQSSS